MHRKMALFPLILAALLATPAASDTGTADRGRELAEALDTKDKGYQDAVAKLTMIIRNSAGEETRRELTVKTLEQTNDGDYSLMRFEFPADIRGTTLLTQPNHDGEDRQWLFMPSINRVKRISSRNKSGPFVGSEFSFEDLSDHSVDDYEYQLLGKADCALSLNNKDHEERRKNIQCERLERIPKDKYSGYSKEILSVDPEHYRIVKIQYYDRKGSLLKVFSTYRFKLFDNEYWRPLKVEMSNVQTGKTTELHYDKLTFGTGLNNSDFHRSALSH
ncbi:outer membrane lipoprotein-sorting protein [Marinimicrobium locisalis]|uniref:outer membrane lipoprotein-sorting protein n=1 Tax=Marinimicrobium locisalis TaxID=546022 RepID=UPI003221409F